MNDDGTWSVIDISAPLPYVQNEMVTIMPGETLYIEAEIYDDRLRYMTAVPEVRHPETTLVLKFEIKAENQWWLTLENPFPETIKYHAQMMLPDGADTYETSSCPIKSGIPVIEMWPHAIFQLILFDFRVVDSNSEEAGLCVY